jgi:rubrerythrin
LARECAVPGLARIFMMMADEEVKHYNVIDRLSRKETSPQLMEARILENVKNMFVTMKAAIEYLHIDTTKAAS